MSSNNILQSKSAIFSGEIKGNYLAPTITRIRFDNEISLQLQSTPPEGPGGTETRFMSPEYFNNDPFKSNQA